ncbi:30S ribosomal protein S8 [Candidatus Roizmanbacteria bacterium]|nr:30S ribosomal protein S8 [Candidatus Roizmanbacteria bacterium]
MENSVNDLIIRIKNGYMARKVTILSPHSGFREEVLKKLTELKFIKGYKIDKIIKDQFKEITIELLYDKGQPAMTDVKIFSKPGSRYYVSYRDLKPVLSGYGFSIISSSFGIVTDKEAKTKKLGGELLFNIW